LSGEVSGAGLEWAGRGFVRYWIRYLVDFGALALLYGLVLFRRWRARGRDCLVVNTLLYAYLSLVLFVTLMPVITAIPFVWNHPYQPMNLVPFADVLAGRGDFVRQVALNVVMTMPFGFLFPLTRTGDGRFGRTVLACLCVSLGIELLQPLINGTRSSDVTDIITNTAGGVIGFGLYLLFRPVTGWILGRLRAGKQGDGP